MPIRVVLADDHTIVRDGLKSLLQQSRDVDVAGVAENGRQAMDMVEQLKPDVVLMDISMADMNGIEATRRIVSGYPGVLVIVLSMHSDRRFVLEALNAGARGYLLKDSAFEDLVTAIQTVVAGEFFLSPKIAGIIVQDYIRRTPVPSETAFSMLTTREREVLQLIAEGKSTKEIAFTFNVSIKTVETQRQQLMRKLKIFNVAELTKYAIREGLTSLD